jgi:hypothetical protein
MSSSRKWLPIVLLALLCGGDAVSADSQLVASLITAADPDHPDRTRFGTLEFRGGLKLSWSHAAFGGWSAARLEGQTLTSVSDVGNWIRLTLHHDGRGWLVDAQRDGSGPLRRLDGAAIGDDKRWRDAEGLTRWRGGWVVSFERHHRLWFYPSGIDGVPAPLDGPPEMAALPDNEGVEAVAALTDGRLLLLAESGGAGWLGVPGDWQSITWTVTDDFHPTDLIQLPNGDLVVLERRFSVLGGFAARLSLVPGATIAPGARLEGRELLRLAPPWTVDNFEGLAVGQGPNGEPMLYLISDDNFSPLQATLLLAFAVVGESEH